VGRLPAATRQDCAATLFGASTAARRCSSAAVRKLDPSDFLTFAAVALCSRPSAAQQVYAGAGMIVGIHERSTASTLSTADRVNGNSATRIETGRQLRSSADLRRSGEQDRPHTSTAVPKSTRPHRSPRPLQIRFCLHAPGREVVPAARSATCLTSGQGEHAAGPEKSIEAGWPEARPDKIEPVAARGHTLARWRFSVPDWGTRHAERFATVLGQLKQERGTSCRPVESPRCSRRKLRSDTRFNSATFGAAD